MKSFLSGHGMTLVRCLALVAMLGALQGLQCPPPEPPEECTTNADCDDGIFCNGSEVCVDGACSNLGDPCEEGQDCDEDAGACVTPCADDTDCDDGLNCTTDSCVDEVCVFEDVVCDNEDDNLCTIEACAEEGDGACVSVDVTCPEGETCDSATGECVSDVVACETDEDCDDGLFCTGTETCGEDGVCVDGDSPCAEGETCAEGDTGAECTAPPSDTVDFTLGQDNLSGTSGDDTFTAPLEFNAGTGGQIATLQTGDTGNGLAGNDTLNATLNGTALVPTLTGIEDLNFTAFAVTTLTATNISGVNSINSVNSVANLTVNSIQEITNLGLSGITDGASGITANFATSPLTGGADEIGVGLTGSDAGTITIATGGGVTNGFETVNLSTSGDAGSKLVNLTQTNATSLATATVSGAQDLQVQVMPNTVLTYDAMAMTGGLTLGNGTSVNGGTNYATFATADLENVTLGSGDDVLIFNNTLNADDASGTGELIDLGDGTDVVQASFGATVGTQLRLSNVEEVRFNATANAVSINLGSATGLTDVTIENDGTANTFTILNAPVAPNLNFRGNDTQAAQTYDTITYTAPSAASSDTLNVNVNNRGTALNVSGTTNSHTVGGTLTAANFGTLNVTVADGPATVGGITAAAATRFTFTASSNLTLGTVAGGTTTNVDASGVVGNLSATFSTMASGGQVSIGSGTTNTVSIAGSGGTTISVSGGSGDDTITGSAQADVISGGAGTDTITAGSGVDTVVTGSGADTITYDTIVLAANANNVTDFSAGTGGDILHFDATTFTDYASGMPVTFATGGAGAVALTGAVDSAIIRDTAANVLLTTPAAGAQAVIAIATDTGDIYYDADGTFTAGAVIIGNIPTAQVASLVAANVVIGP